MRTAALAAFGFLVAGCATTAPVVDAPTALAGRDMSTALSLYGRYDQKVMLEGRPHYVWRRAVLLNGQTYYCELRAETGYRDLIRSSIVEGYPAACSLFAVKFTNAYDRPAATPAGERTARAAVAPSVGDVSADASARAQ